MKKGIVLESNRNFMVLMTPEGSFHKAKPKKDVKIGEEVTYESIDEKSNKGFKYVPNP